MAITIRKIACPNGDVSNSDDSYTASVASGGSLELPDSQINVNGSNEGNVVSVKTIDVNITDGTNPVVPDAVSLSGNTLDIEVPSAGWERPDDWLAMPSVTSSDDTFVGLHAIFPSGNNFAAFRFTTSTGDYQVDWGDGTITTHASNTTAEHTYDYSTYDAGNSTLSTRGYKQALIVVTPLTGNLTTVNFQLRRTTTPAQNQPYATGFLDCILSMPNANSGRSIVFGGTTVNHRYCEQFSLLNSGICTSMKEMFRNCTSLQSIQSLNTSNITDMEAMFQNCYSLESVPLFDTSNVLNMYGMFIYCYSLKSVPLFDTSNVTTMLVMFYFCYSLKLVPLLNTSNVIIMQGMFANCYSLQSVPLFNTINVENMFAMFDGCYTIQSVPLFDTSSVTNLSTIFRYCESLQQIPAFNTSNVTNMGNFAANCYGLDRTDIVCTVSVNFQNCQLSQSELVNIFNNLIDRSSTTSANISIIGNWGASALTAAERQIATNKNWTITG